MGAVTFDASSAGYEKLEEAKNSARACHEEDVIAVDDVNGKWLDLQEVMKARKKE